MGLRGLSGVESRGLSGVEACLLRVLCWAFGDLLLLWQKGAKPSVPAKLAGSRARWWGLAETVFQTDRLWSCSNSCGDFAL